MSRSICFCIPLAIDFAQAKADAEYNMQQAVKHIGRHGNME